MKNKEKKRKKDPSSDSTGNEKKKEKDTLPFKTIVKNCVWALKLVHQTVPGVIALRTAVTVISTSLGFFVGTWLLRHILNSYQTSETTLGRVLLAVVGVYLFNFVFAMAVDLLNNFLYPRTNMKTQKRVTKMILNKAAECDLECYENPEFYDKYVRAMDHGYQSVVAVQDSMLHMIDSLISVLLNGSLMIIIDPTLLIFTVFPVLFGLLRTRELGWFYKYVKYQKPIDRQKNYIRRTFYLSDYAKEMRLSDMAPLQIRKFRGLYGEYKKVLREYGFKRLLLGFFGETLREQIASVGSVFYAVFRAVVSKTMLVGDCAVTVQSVKSLNQTLDLAVTDVTVFSQHALYIRDMQTFLAYEPKIAKNENGLRAKEGVLAFENVSFSYFGSEKKVIDDLSFTIKPGEHVAIVGRNGAGKSTVIKLLMRLYEPTEGRITLDGIDIREYELSSYRALFAPMFQDYKFFSVSVAENVVRRALREGDEERVREALDLSGASPRIDKLPGGIYNLLTREFDRNGAVLSGGETQKVLLAAVFASDAPCAILDEPSSALDPIAEYRVFEGMKKASEGRALLYISHRLSAAVLSDKIIVMRNGRLAEMGSHEELMASGGEYSEMFTKQSENYYEEAEDHE